MTTRKGPNHVNEEREDETNGDDEPSGAEREQLAQEGRLQQTEEEEQEGE